MSESTRVKADIVPYSSEYARDVVSWIDTEETYMAVCRGQNWPPPADLADTWQRAGVQSYILLSENKPMAYGELWAKPQEVAKEIVHLLVNPYKRSRGYGTKMLELLFDRAAAQPDVAKVIVNLFESDEVALGCYLKAGFELSGASGLVTSLKLIRMVR